MLGRERTLCGWDGCPRCDVGHAWVVERSFAANPAWTDYGKVQCRQSQNHEVALAPKLPPRLCLQRCLLPPARRSETREGRAFRPRNKARRRYTLVETPPIEAYNNNDAGSLAYGPPRRARGGEEGWMGAGGGRGESTRRRRTRTRSSCRLADWYRVCRSFRSHQPRHCKRRDRRAHRTPSRLPSLWRSAATGLVFTPRSGRMEPCERSNVMRWIPARTWFK